MTNSEFKNSTVVVISRCLYARFKPWLLTIPVGTCVTLFYVSAVFFHYWRKCRMIYFYVKNEMKLWEYKKSSCSLQCYKKIIIIPNFQKVTRRCMRAKSHHQMWNSWQTGRMEMAEWKTINHISGNRGI